MVSKSRKVDKPCVGEIPTPISASAPIEECELGILDGGQCHGKVVTKKGMLGMEKTEYRIVVLSVVPRSYWVLCRT